MSGHFITIEGTDGSGKSSLVKHLIKWLKEIDKVEDQDFIVTKEPGSLRNEFCTALREMILNPVNKIDKEAEIFLYMADRCQHVYKVIRPALEQGKIVICDRYIDSTFAYQGFGRRRGTHEALEKINYLNKISTNDLVPDLTLVLLVKPEIALKRIATSEFGKPDRIEQEKLDFHTRVYNGYKELIKQNNLLRIVDRKESSNLARRIEVIDTEHNDDVKTFNLARYVISVTLPHLLEGTLSKGPFIQFMKETINASGIPVSQPAQENS